MGGWRTWLKAAVIILLTGWGFAGIAEGMKPRGDSGNAAMGGMLLAGAVLLFRVWFGSRG